MVKLKASIGFHAIALVRIAIVIFRIGVAARTSYRQTLRSSAADASTWRPEEESIGQVVHTHTDTGGGRWTARAYIELDRVELDCGHSVGSPLEG